MDRNTCRRDCFMKRDSYQEKPKRNSRIRHGSDNGEKEREICRIKKRNIDGWSIRCLLRLLLKLLSHFYIQNDFQLDTYIQVPKKNGSQTSKQLHPHYILNERKNSEEYFVIRVRRTRIFWNSRLSKVYNFSLHGYFSSKKFISLMNAVSQALCIPFTHPWEYRKWEANMQIIEFY